jgi:hypothetical protein
MMNEVETRVIFCTCRSKLYVLSHLALPLKFGDRRFERVRPRTFRDKDMSR